MMSLGTKTTAAAVRNRHKAGQTTSDIIELDRTEMERRCTQALLVILPQVRQIINPRPGAGKRWVRDYGPAI